MLVIRELLLRPCRYGDLLAALPGIGTNLLAARLKQMEADGLLRKRKEPGKRASYVLTDLGRSLEPVLLELVRWQWRRQTDNEPGFRQNHWSLLGLKAFFDPARAAGLSLVVSFCGEPDVHVGMLDGQLRWWLGDARPPRADLEVQATIADFFKALRSGERITEGRVGDITFTGDPKHLARFAHCFPSK